MAGFGKGGCVRTSDSPLPANNLNRNGGRERHRRFLGLERVPWAGASVKFTSPRIPMRRRSSNGGRTRRLIPVSRTASLPAQLDSSNPTCDGSLGSRGQRKNTGPLAAGGASMRNRGQQRTSVCGTGVEDSLKTHRLLCNPRGLVRGPSGTLSLSGHSLLQTSLDGQASGGQRGFAPLHPPPGASPWTPDGLPHHQPADAPFRSRDVDVARPSAPMAALRRHAPSRSPGTYATRLHPHRRSESRSSAGRPGRQRSPAPLPAR
ncbi:hypothetical protein VT03_01660 [Planctomyces sp. SH-PL14]|nr:hypothetical protein VT03_01660 [Planctomyces sp. SH-PL14]